ncbi:DUF3861 domain-containing protein [Vibrio sp. SM6]|uniref:DUF3861 domain-containing protein n=1 Tax=Vibrio agarilyticus TaxID=2726741 RepID=A0A7X8TNA3_9VIBR|nr:DUF3861 domain-containing protein [Vibrio agarilyticus]NLS11883.1 DUF3861 domain-containing protein [Vibrio agarilyticus]
MALNIRKDKHYTITIEEMGVDEPKTLQFEYQDREDLFKAVEKIQQGSGLEPNVATKVAVAVRLLGPVMMADRKHPLFVDFMPHFRAFMQNLKSTVKLALKGE